MACLLVPVAEAIVVAVVTKAMKAKNSKEESLKSNSPNISSEAEYKIPFVRKLKWLSNLLWGGSALLAFEHIWHGEIVPWFPFLTAARSPEETAAMLREMSTVGVSMTVLITAVWIGMVLVTSAMERKALKAQIATH